MNETGSLLRYDEMCRAIDAAYEVDEVSDIRDKARAIELYMHQQRNPEPERRACEIRLRAERKLGLLTSQMDRAQGKRTDLSTSPHHETKSLKEQLDEHGISKTQADRWSKLAALSDGEFEAALSGPDKPTTNGIIHGAFPAKPKPVSPEALWLWGRLKDFDRDGILTKTPEAVLLTMTPEMCTDVHLLAPKVAAWLRQIGDLT